VAHELSVPISSWQWWRWWSLVHLSLHVGGSVRHVGKQLSLGGVPGAVDSAEDWGWYCCSPPIVALQADQLLSRTWCSPFDWLEE
jgi:hypothetical protein